MREASQPIDPSAIAGELDESEDGAESALEQVTVVSAEERRRQVHAGRSLADADASLLPQDDFQRVRCLAEDRLVLGQQGSCDLESLERRSPQRPTAGDSEHAANVDQRLQRTVTELKCLVPLASAVD